MNERRFAFLTATVVLGLSLALSGCSRSTPQPEATGSEPAASAEAAPTQAAPAMAAEAAVPAAPPAPFAGTPRSSIRVQYADEARGEINADNVEKVLADLERELDEELAELDGD